MNITPINSVANPLLKRVRNLHDRAGREKLGLFLLEGPKLFQEALEREIEILNVVVSASFMGGDFDPASFGYDGLVHVVDDKIFADLYTTTTTCGLVAVAKPRRAELEDVLQPAKTALLAIVESVQDPGNLGTIIRTALAFGATALICTSGSVDVYNPKVVRSAMGALFTLPIVTGASLSKVIDLMEKNSIQVVALEPDSDQLFWELDMTQPVAFIFGNEGRGLSEATLKRVSNLVKIPMTGAVESLNVAVSAAVVLYECARQRSLS